MREASHLNLAARWRPLTRKTKSIWPSYQATSSSRSSRLRLLRTNDESRMARLTLEFSSSFIGHQDLVALDGIRHSTRNCSRSACLKGLSFPTPNHDTSGMTCFANAPKYSITSVNGRRMTRSMRVRGFWRSTKPLQRRFPRNRFAHTTIRCRGKVCAFMEG